MEASVAFPQRRHQNLTQPVGEPLIFYTNRRYRLPGMFDGWFYYEDVYKKRIRLTTFYEGVDMREQAGKYRAQGWRCVQLFHEGTAARICQQIDRQLRRAFRWMRWFERLNR